MEPSSDFSFRIGDVVFKNPFIVGSGPTVKNLDQIKHAEDAGWAGASIKLAIQPFPYISFPPRYRWLKGERYHIFTAEHRLTADEALALTERACKRAGRDFVVIPTMTYDGEDLEGWGKLARRFVDAGARIVELNLCCPNMSFNVSSMGASTVKHTGASLGNDMVEMPKVVKAVSEAAGVPVIAKFSADGNMAPLAGYKAVQAGAAAIGHNGNLLGIPDIDIRQPLKGIYRLQDQITLGCMSGPAIRPLALRTTYQMRQAAGPEAVLISSGGASDLKSSVEHLLVGADAVWICTETMLRGFDWLPKMLDQFTAYMRDMGFARLSDLRGLLSKNIASASELVVHEGRAVFDSIKCNACGACWKIGHCCAITHPDGATVYDGERCLACSTCVDLCPTGAFSMERK
jgi:dihydroorotate dehydrogenase/Pyruvate/2-oxoacid:ferredoxin oxidoreductase delta subunit